MKLIGLSYWQGVDLKLKKVVNILAIMFKHRKPRYQYSTCPSLNSKSEGSAILGYLYCENKIAMKSFSSRHFISHIG